MRFVGTLPDANRARVFSAWMLAQGMETKVEPAGQEWEVWIKDEDHAQRAVECYREFLSQPDDPRYQASVSQAAAIAREKEEKRRRYQKQVRQVRGSSLGLRRGPLTVTLIVLSAIVALMTNFGDRTIGNATFEALAFHYLPPPIAANAVESASDDLNNWSLRMASITRGEGWRLITPIFIHFSVAHLLFNSIMLFQFGRIIETRFSTASMAILVVTAAVLGNTIQVLDPGGIDQMTLYFDGMRSAALIGGLSGVVYAAFGFVWMKSLYDPSAGLFLPPSTIIIMVGWLIFCMLPGFEDMMGFRVANWAHAVGLVVGMFFGIFSKSR